MGEKKIKYVMKDYAIAAGELQKTIDKTETSITPLENLRWALAATTTSVTVAVTIAAPPTDSVKLLIIKGIVFTVAAVTAEKADAYVAKELHTKNNLLQAAEKMQEYVHDHYKLGRVSMPLNLKNGLLHDISKMGLPDYKRCNDPKRNIIRGSFVLAAALATAYMVEEFSEDPEVAQRAQEILTQPAVLPERRKLESLKICPMPTSN